MFYVSSIRNNLVDIIDIYDNIEEFYSVDDIKEFTSYIIINGGIIKLIKDDKLSIEGVEFQWIIKVTFQLSYHLQFQV